MQQLSSHDLIRENVHKYHETSHQPCTESGSAKQVLQRWAPNHEIISELEADQPLGQERARKVVCKMNCSACNTFDQIGIPSSTFWCASSTQVMMVHGWVASMFCSWCGIAAAIDTTSDFSCPLSSSKISNCNDTTWWLIDQREPKRLMTMFIDAVATVAAKIVLRIIISVKLSHECFLSMHVKTGLRFTSVLARVLH